MHRHVSTVLLGGLLLGLTGCQQVRQNQADIVALTNTVNRDLELLKRQNTFMNRKLNKLQESVEEATEVSKDLREELSTYANRPDEVRLEIINDVNTRFAQISKSNEEFKAAVNEQFDDHTAATKERLDTSLAELEKILSSWPRNRIPSTGCSPTGSTAGPGTSPSSANGKTRNARRTSTSNRSRRVRPGACARSCGLCRAVT